MKINENTSVSMPVKNMLAIIFGVVAGVFAYTELTARLVSLETSRELFENDLLKKSEQVPVDQEQHFLLEDLYKTTDKFLEYFGINRLSDLPKLKEISEIIASDTSLGEQMAVFENKSREENQMALGSDQVSND